MNEASSDLLDEPCAPWSATAESLSWFLHDLAMTATIAHGLGPNFGAFADTNRTSQYDRQM
jgi:hypothetical protein